MNRNNGNAEKKNDKMECLCFFVRSLDECRKYLTTSRVPVDIFIDLNVYDVMRLPAFSRLLLV